MAAHTKATLALLDQIADTLDGASSAADGYQNGRQLIIDHSARHPRDFFVIEQAIEYLMERCRHWDLWR